MSEEFLTPRFRIEKIELQNVKSVGRGVIEFNCLKTPFEKDTCSDILGIYGQNGSGKTTLLEALQVAKLAMMGENIPFEKYGNIIAQDADYARISITFQASNPDGSLYHLEYAFSLGTWEFSNTTSSNNGKVKYVTEIAGGTISSTALRTSTLAAALGFTNTVGANLGILTGAAATTAALAFLSASLFAVGGAASVITNRILKSSNSKKEVLKYEGKVKRLAIFDEVINLSGMFNNSTVRLGPIFDASTEDVVFLPKARQKDFFPSKTTSMLKELQNFKNYSLVTSKSFIFCDELSQLFLQQESISPYAQIILDLKTFAIQKIRILDSKIIRSSENDVIPIFTSISDFEIIRKDSTIFLDDGGLKNLQTALKGLNVVLRQVIPGLSLEAVRQVDIDLYEQNVKAHSSSTKVTVYSVRDNVRIPLSEESPGIIRLISSMGLFVYAFVSQDVTVAIDEIDAGVYEYLLGELLLIFEEYGNGQLIFTCHNLRPMEVLNKKYIYFTTTNPENRYLKPKNIRNENNLRDVYLREIVNGGQEEDLYSATKHGKIAAALQKAGDIFEQE